jgi:hypothetical protein
MYHQSIKRPFTIFLCLTVRELITGRRVCAGFVRTQTPAIEANPTFEASILPPKKRFSYFYILNNIFNVTKTVNK